jgi:hypothetical protein
MPLSRGIVLISTLVFILIAPIGHELAASNPATSTQAVVKVEPELTEFGNPAGDPIPIPGTQFTVTINLYNVTNLYGLDLQFKWNTTFLRYVNHSIHVPKDTYPDGVLWKPVFLLADRVNATAGTYWIAYISMNPAPLFNGSGTVFNMTFEVIDQPFDYETGRSTVDPIDILLHFSSTDLAAFDGPPIPHTSENATVRIWEKLSQVSAYPILKVEPEKVENMPIFSAFDISIWIIGVDSQYDIQSFNITLNFNSILIEATTISEGPWLKSYAQNTTESTKRIDNESGTVTYALEQVPPTIHPPPTTSGILFAMSFRVIYESLEYPPPSCGLTLGPTEILDRYSGSLQHATENGTYTAYRPLPIAKFTWSPSSNSLPPNQTITFNASESYPPLGIKLYIWDFGDGAATAVTTPLITHVYKMTGTFIVVLNVTDYEDFWNTASARLCITEPQAFPQISVINPLTEDHSFTFYVNNTSIGFRFNATVWASDAIDLASYQVRLYYNSTLLKATRAWLPRFDSQWVFYGKNTAEPQPSFENNNVQVSDAIMGAIPTFSGSGLLGIIEFEIISAPSTGRALSSLDITNNETYLLNHETGNINASKADGYYMYVHNETSKASSSITLSANPTPVTVGANVTISGTITPARPHANVTIYYEPQDELWMPLATIETDNQSNYSYIWTTTTLGTFNLKANWLGDENTYPAESETETVKIEPQPNQVTLQIIILIAAMAILVATSLYFAKIRKRNK